MDDIRPKYLKWIAAKLGRTDISFLEKLYEIDYQYFRSMDADRWEDGIDLRYRFGNENDIPMPIIYAKIDNSPCSMLEMLAALAIKLEENIMYDPEEGDRTGKWFDAMLYGLDLNDEDAAEDLQQKIDNFELGRVGLYGDARPCNDVWYQSMKYLNTYRKPLWQEE